MDPILIAVIGIGIIAIGFAVAGWAHANSQAIEFMEAPLVDPPLTQGQVDMIVDAEQRLHHRYRVLLQAKQDEYNKIERKLAESETLRDRNIETIIRMDATIDGLIAERDAANLELEQLKHTHSVLWSQFEEQRNELEHLRERHDLQLF